MIERRPILIGLGALFAAPAIVKASSLMKIAPTSKILFTRADYMALNQITREAVQLFKNGNVFIKEIDKQYTKDFAFMEGEQWGTLVADGTGSLPVGSELRIRLPNDYVVGDRPIVTINPNTQLISLWDRPPVPQIPNNLALAAVAVAAVPVLLEKPVTRRFWSK